MFDISSQIEAELLDYFLLVVIISGLFKNFMFITFWPVPLAIDKLELSVSEISEKSLCLSLSMFFSFSFTIDTNLGSTKSLGKFSVVLFFYLIIYFGFSKFPSELL